MKTSVLIYIQLSIIAILLIFFLVMHISIKQHRRVRKIGYSILLKDKFPTDTVWDEYFSKIPNQRYKAVIHGKDNISSKINPDCTTLLRSTFVPSIETKWGHYTIVKAQIATIRELLKDPEIDRICFISGNCIPLRSFYDSVKILEKCNKSIFTLFNMTVRFPRFEELLKYGIHPDDVGFHHQWCIIRRDHAQLLVDKFDEYIEWFKEIHAPDECAIMTVLQHYKVPKDQLKLVSCLNKVNGEDGMQGTTFTQWHDINYRYHLAVDKLSVSSPKIYKNISYEEMMHVINKSYCIFGRKFTNETNVIMWDETRVNISDFLRNEHIM